MSAENAKDSNQNPDNLTRPEYVELLKWHLDCAHRHMTIFQAVNIAVFIAIFNGAERIGNLNFTAKCVIFTGYLVALSAILPMMYGEAKVYSDIYKKAKADKNVGKAIETGFCQLNIPLLVALNGLMTFAIALIIMVFLFANDLLTLALPNMRD